jgi:hypothetical protein
MKLLDEVIAAYGGLERWKELHTIKIHQSADPGAVRRLRRTFAAQGL